jgi:SAM-dependent methyltransferase
MGTVAPAAWHDGGVDVFGANDVGFLRAAAVAAGHELSLFEALAVPRPCAELGPALGIATGRRRLRALVEALVGLGVIERDGDTLRMRAAPGPGEVPPAGWGLIAEVVRRDRPLGVERGATRRLHAHLARAGAEAARELAPLLRGPRLVDLGGGAGTYTAAFLAAHPAGRATLVDRSDVIPIARDFLAPVAERVELVASEIEAVPLGDGHDSALLANVLHLHGPEACARLCEVAAKLVRPGGCVVIKDLRVDDGRAGPVEGLLFALNMAIYTDAGDVYTTSELCAWLAAAGLVDIEQHRLRSSPNAIVVIGTRPARATVGEVGGLPSTEGAEARSRPS